MRRLSPALIAEFQRELRHRRKDAVPLVEPLKWLRYYLDFCAKYHEPPRDRESLDPFLHKLASKRQTPEQQNQAAESVNLYYEIME